MRFVGGLPAYARRTTAISHVARRVRDAVVQAREPAALLFERLPAACGCPTIGAEQADNAVLGRFKTALRAALVEIGGAYPALVDRARVAIARHLTISETAADRMAVELRERAGRVGGLAVEPVLARFVMRAADEALDPDDLVVSLLTLLADKPPHDWTDADEERFDVRLAEVARRFRTAEALAVEGSGADGPPLVRLAVARPGRRELERVLALRADDHDRVAAAADRMLRAAARAAGARLSPDETLAALAVAAERLLADESDAEGADA